ncbi:MAG: NAD(P)-dependent oxidoreductase [Solirubrobacteraceae bacterium MAG38_C4-C5]|nr:NAD(P)-dependent oxidoreductase [Candidatus Siliceabacter maunaloa]
MRLLVTGATGYLGWRATVLLRERGHTVTALTRPGARDRAAARGLDIVACDAGDPAARDLVAGHEAVLHFAGIPDPARARVDPAAAVRANVGTTLNLLEGCAHHGVALVYPSSVRAALEPAPDPYAASKRLGEEACRLHTAPTAVVRLASVFGPGQVAWEGATGAIAAFVARALEGRPIVIPGAPGRTRDFLYVDDLVEGLERLLREGPWDRMLTAASGTSTPLLEAARAARDAAGTGVEIELPGGDLPPGENESYAPSSADGRLSLTARPLREAVTDYVDWLRRHPAAEGRAQA